ncbi:MAG: response regulator [Anaerolineae bacterium]|nr:response regulator [Anaerolineae bacterium]MCB0182123.1 response regulator [Anaerolineae bacterium]MCB0225502.1 response regulator [Anaerolineae bacterium]MCB9105437.1 response regulator [Anaerolineales bacterium]
MSEQPLKKLKRLTPQGSGRGPIRVLYVEDSAVIRDTIARLLELKGYKVNYAKNGQEGIELAQSWKPQVVLMDLRMPVMDGYNAINELRANPATSHLPIFVLSAWSSKKERTQAKLAGADEFFVKPPDLNRLIEAINKAVE